ncbi:MAG: DUF4129 domain-containing protein [Pedobacter sp.]|nr:MAG: DUF4129 domain-containing protein [Pedobacter sp.]
MKYILLFIALIMVVHASAYAATAQQKKQIKNDTSSVTVHFIEKEKIRSLKKDPEFQYKEMVPAQMSLWDRFWAWIWRMINNAARFSGSNPILRYAFFSIGGAVVIYIMYRVLRADKMFLNSGAKNVLNYEVYPENIHTIDYDKEITALIAERNYRLATRLLYLRSLKQLNDSGSIAWQPGKTNFAYVNEIKNAEVQQPFRSLTQQFDYIWYGHFPVDEENFKPIHFSFNAFKERFT